MQAQIAANERGAHELRRIVEQYGLEVVQAYMQHVQNNAEESVRRVIDVLKPGRFDYLCDGADAVQTHMTNSRLTDPEVLEWRFPVLVEAFSIRSHSGGLGKHRGGNGAIRRIQFREPMTAAILSGHRIVPPFGLAGGQSGEIGRNSIVRQDGSIESLTSKAEVSMNPQVMSS